MGDVNDFEVAYFSGLLLWMNSVLELYGKDVWRGFKQIIPDLQNKTYFKNKYIAHTHPNNHTFLNQL